MDAIFILLLIITGTAWIIYFVCDKYEKDTKKKQLQDENIKKLEHACNIFNSFALFCSNIINAYGGKDGFFLFIPLLCKLQNPKAIASANYDIENPSMEIKMHIANIKIRFYLYLLNLIEINMPDKAEQYIKILSPLISPLFPQNNISEKIIYYRQANYEMYKQILKSACDDDNNFGTPLIIFNETLKNYYKEYPTFDTGMKDYFSTHYPLLKIFFSDVIESLGLCENLDFGTISKKYHNCRGSIDTYIKDPDFNRKEFITKQTSSLYNYCKEFDFINSPEEWNNIIFNIKLSNDYKTSDINKFISLQSKLYDMIINCFKTHLDGYINIFDKIIFKTFKLNKNQTDTFFLNNKLTMYISHIIALVSVTDDTKLIKGYNHLLCCLLNDFPDPEAAGEQIISKIRSSFDEKKEYIYNYLNNNSLVTLSVSLLLNDYQLNVTNNMIEDSGTNSQLSIKEIIDFKSTLQESNAILVSFPSSLKYIYSVFILNLFTSYNDYLKALKDFENLLMYDTPFKKLSDEEIKTLMQSDEYYNMLNKATTDICKTFSIL